jgi:hypothetical protein
LGGSREDEQGLGGLGTRAARSEREKCELRLTVSGGSDKLTCGPSAWHGWALLLLPRRTRWTGETARAGDGLGNSAAWPAGERRARGGGEALGRAQARSTRWAVLRLARYLGCGGGARWMGRQAAGGVSAPLGRTSGGRAWWASHVRGRGVGRQGVG